MQRTHYSQKTKEKKKKPKQTGVDGGGGLYSKGPRPFIWANLNVHGADTLII